MEEAGLPTLGVGLPKVGKYVAKRKLSDGTQKTYFYDRGTTVRKNVELTFDNESEKLKFEQKCDLLMSHLGCKSLKETLTKLVMDYKVEDRRPALFRPLLPFGPEDPGTFHRPTFTWPFPFQPSIPSRLTPDVATNIRQDWHWPLPAVSSGPIPNVATQPRSIPTSGIADASTDSETAHLPSVQPEQEHYIGQCSSIFDLLDAYSKHLLSCACPLITKTMKHAGHVLEMVMVCRNQHTLLWSSSTLLPCQRKEYTVNHRMMLAFLASGIAPIEYERFSEFSQFGALSQNFRRAKQIRFGAIIKNLRERSVSEAKAEEVSRSPNGKMAVVTDVRHHGDKNSYHADHFAIGVISHKIVDIQHATRKTDLGRSEMTSSDIQDKGAAKTPPTGKWQCTKHIANGVKSIGRGAKGEFGKTWHPELADKTLAVRNHVYWCLDHCNRDPHLLRQLIDTCVPHLQGNHDACHETYECKTEGYVLPTNKLTDTVAAEVLTSFMRGLTEYRKAEDFVHWRESFYVDSFNNVCLVYLDKRLHYGDATYELRSNLAVLDWNENVNRPCTSLRQPSPASLPMQAGKKTYKKKTYDFVLRIWKTYSDFSLDASTTSNDVTAATTDTADTSTMRENEDSPEDFPEDSRDMDYVKCEVGGRLDQDADDVKCAVLDLRRINKTELENNSKPIS